MELLDNDGHACKEFRRDSLDVPTIGVAAPSCAISGVPRCEDRDQVWIMPT
jgi:hypothetical protein